jgi:hypothetical protein
VAPRSVDGKLARRAGRDPRGTLVGSENSIHWVSIAGKSEHDWWMFAIAFLFVRVLCDCFKSRRRLEAEVLVLRHQLNVLQRAPVCAENLIQDAWALLITLAYLEKVSFQFHSLHHHPVANGSQSIFCREKTRGICSILRRTSAPWNAGTPNRCPVRSTVRLRPSTRCGARAKKCGRNITTGPIADLLIEQLGL